MSGRSSWMRWSSSSCLAKVFVWLMCAVHASLAQLDCAKPSSFIGRTYRACAWQSCNPDSDAGTCTVINDELFNSVLASYGIDLTALQQTLQRCSSAGTELVQLQRSQGILSIASLSPTIPTTPTLTSTTAPTTLTAPTVASTTPTLSPTTAPTTAPTPPGTVPAEPTTLQTTVPSDSSPSIPSTSSAPTPAAVVAAPGSPTTVPSDSSPSVPSSSSAPAAVAEAPGDASAGRRRLTVSSALHLRRAQARLENNARVVHTARARAASNQRAAPCNHGDSNSPCDPARQTSILGIRAASAGNGPTAGAEGVRRDASLVSLGSDSAGNDATAAADGARRDATLVSLGSDTATAVRAASVVRSASDYAHWLTAPIVAHFSQRQLRADRETAAQAPVTPAGDDATTGGYTMNVTLSDSAGPAAPGAPAPNNADNSGTGVGSSAQTLDLPLGVPPPPDPSNDSAPNLAQREASILLTLSHCPSQSAAPSTSAPSNSAPSDSAPSDSAPRAGYEESPDAALSTSEAADLLRFVSDNCSEVMRVPAGLVFTQDQLAAVSLAGDADATVCVARQVSRDAYVAHAECLATRPQGAENDQTGCLVTLLQMYNISPDAAAAIDAAYRAAATICRAGVPAPTNPSTSPNNDGSAGQGDSVTDTSPLPAMTADIARSECLTTRSAAARSSLDSAFPADAEASAPDDSNTASANIPSSLLLLLLLLLPLLLFDAALG